MFDRRLISKLRNSEIVESRRADRAVLSQDGRCLAGIWDNYSPPYSEPVDYTIRIIDMTTDRELAHIKYEGPFENITFSPNHKYFLVSGVLDWVHSDLLYETDGAKEVMRLEPDGDMTAFQFSPDSKYVATVIRDGTVRTWQLSNRQEISRIVTDGRAQSVAFKYKRSPADNT